MVRGRKWRTRESLMENRGTPLQRRAGADVGTLREREREREGEQKRRGARRGRERRAVEGLLHTKAAAEERKRGREGEGKGKEAARERERERQREECPLCTAE